MMNQILDPVVVGKIRALLVENLVTIGRLSAACGEMPNVQRQMAEIDAVLQIIGHPPPPEFLKQLVESTPRVIAMECETAHMGEARVIEETVTEGVKLDDASS